jgi:hypothetical protein
VLVKHRRYQDALEGIAREHVLPLFGSPFAFLRAKAAWLAGVFAREVKFSRADGSQAKGDGLLFDQLFDHVLRCMKDRCAAATTARCWAVCAAASCALRHHVRCGGCACCHLAQCTWLVRCCMRLCVRSPPPAPCMHENNRCIALCSGFEACSTVGA